MVEAPEGPTTITTLGAPAVGDAAMVVAGPSVTLPPVAIAMATMNGAARRTMDPARRAMGLADSNGLPPSYPNTTVAVAIGGSAAWSAALVYLGKDAPRVVESDPDPADPGRATCWSSAAAAGG